MKVILTTDFTPASDNAIDYALGLFKEEKDMEYILFHAYKSMVPYSNTPPTITVINNDELEEKLEDKLQAIKEFLSDEVSISSSFKQGTLRKALDELIEEEEPDLVVMGSRDKGTMERMALGSNVIDVSSKINCPVLTVPIEAKYKELDTIVFASDLEPLHVNYDSLTMLKKLANKAGSKLDVLHVFEDEEQEKEALKNQIEDSALHRYLSDVDHKHSAVINSSVTDGLTSYVNEKEPDLLTVIPRDRNFIEKIFHNSTTEKMIYHTQVPMLLML